MAAQEKQQELELILNEISADQAVVRITMQCFLLNLSRQRPEMLQDMKAQVLSAIAQTLPSDDPSERQGAERRKQLTLVRAEGLFLEIEEALGQTGTGNERRDVN